MWWTIAGLVFDIVGVTMLFFYGLPSNLHLPPQLELEGGLTEKEKEENKILRRKARTALGLIIAGFAFQIVGIISASC